MTKTELAERLGGRASLGREIQNELDLALAIQDGLPVAVIEEVRRAGTFTDDEMREILHPSLAKREREGGHLTVEESDRLVRAVRVAGKAEETFGDAEPSGRWLRQPNRALAGERPLSLLKTDAGARMVETVLGRIEHGIPS